MVKSPFLLSLSTVFALLGLALLTIGIVSDNWVEYAVFRKDIIQAMNKQPDLSAKLKDAITKNPIYFSRNIGLFHVCFPDVVPSNIGSFFKLGAVCVTNTDYFPEDNVKEAYTTEQLYRFYLMRGTITAFTIGLAIIFFCLIFGFIGCWQRSASNIGVCAITMLISVLFFTGAMASWHYTLHMENRTLEMPPFYKSWEPILKQTTAFHYGWSYFASCTGIALILLGGCTMLWSYRAMKREEDKVFENKHNSYMLDMYNKPAFATPYGYATYGYAGSPYAPAPYYNPYGQQSIASGMPQMATNYGYMTYGHQ
uniref:Uncharacterized protein n=1 Tax=Rhabditophanes sp. KR3021 TaxID=114890 RepID=A0AC35TZ15_9BILA